MPYIAPVMKWIALRVVGAVLAAVVCLVPVQADTSAEVYRAMGMKPADVLAGTVLTARVLPDGGKQVVSLTTYFTGAKEKENAVNVRLDVFRTGGNQLASIYTRDFGAENGGFVAEGDLQLVDLDRDGLAEIVVTFADYSDPLIDLRLGEVILHDERGFYTAWAHPVKYDATRAARSVPLERRDRFVRELDIVNTMRTRGVTLFFEKKMIAVAGERLAEPKVIQETFPLRDRER
jgi:hypothetical protein